MSPCRVQVGLADRLPDDHLVHTAFAPGKIIKTYHTGHISLPLLDDLCELIRHIGRSPNLVLDPARAGEPAGYESFYERVNPDLMPLCPFFFRKGMVDGREWLGFYVRADMMSKEMCDEINGFTIPWVAGALRFTAPTGLVVPLPQSRPRFPAPPHVSGRDGPRTA